MYTIFDLIHSPLEDEIKKKMFWHIVLAAISILLGMSSILIAIILSISYRI